MGSKVIKLDELPRAVGIQEKYYEIATSDGKRYLCELIGQKEVSDESPNHYPIPDILRKYAKEDLSRFLTENDLTPDIIHETESVDKISPHGADNEYRSEYLVSVYKIIEKLSE